MAVARSFIQPTMTVSCWGLLHWKGRPTGWAEETFRQLCRAGASQFAARNGLRSQV